VVKVTRTRTRTRQLLRHGKSLGKANHSCHVFFSARLRDMSTELAYPKRRRSNKPFNPLSNCRLVAASEHLRSKGKLVTSDRTRERVARNTRAAVARATAVAVVSGQEPAPSFSQPLVFPIPTHTLSASPQENILPKERGNTCSCSHHFIITPHCFFVLPQTATLFIEFIFFFLFFLLALPLLFHIPDKGLQFFARSRFHSAPNVKCYYDNNNNKQSQ